MALEGDPHASVRDGPPRQHPCLALTATVPGGSVCSPSWRDIRIQLGLLAVVRAVPRGVHAGPHAPISHASCAPGIMPPIPHASCAPGIMPQFRTHHARRASVPSVLAGLRPCQPTLLPAVPPPCAWRSCRPLPLWGRTAIPAVSALRIPGQWENVPMGFLRFLMTILS